MRNDKKLLDLIRASTDNFSAIAAFIEVETGGKGFDSKTGKIIIQFEPTWFRKKEPFAPSGEWSVNKVDVQSKEWVAFNNAFSIDKKSAMESTSIGMGQIMGFHWMRLGYPSVDAMWEDAKSGINRQIVQIISFIDSDAKLKSAIDAKDWPTVAKIYNGPKYKEIAAKYGRVPYDVAMKDAFTYYSKL